MKRQVFIICSLITTLFFTCKKDGESGRPSTYVDFSINTSNPAYSNLNAIGGWIYDTHGVRGIIIYRKSITDFMAYERNCTYQPSNACAKVQVQSSGITAIDSCCGSKFLMVDGSVYGPPATIQLTRYQTEFDGTTLHIFN